MIKEIKIAYLASCLGLIIIVTLLNSEYFFSSLQTYLGSFESIKIGDALISKPESWFVIYKKDKQDSYGFSYGYIPYRLSNQPGCLAFFIIKRLGAKNEVTFCQMNSDSVAKSNAVLKKLHNSPNNDIKVIKVGEFDSLISKFYQTNFLIDIPVLGISIVVNNVDDLSQFNFKMVEGGR